MNTNVILCFDLETVSKITHIKGRLDASVVEPAQIAAVPIDPITMDICKYGGVFDSLMCPEGNWRDRLDPGALMKNKLDPEKISQAPPRRDVWLAFADWAAQFNPKGRGKVLTNPIPAGKNIAAFDCPIVEWMSEKYGTSDEKGLQKVFNRRPGSQWGIILDIEHDLWRWFEGPDGDLQRLNMDYVRDYFGLPPDGGHTALVDAMQTAEILCRFLRHNRRMFKQMNFKGSMKGWKMPEVAKR